MVTIPRDLPDIKKATLFSRVAQFQILKSKV